MAGWTFGVGASLVALTMLTSAARAKDGAKDKDAGKAKEIVKTAEALRYPGKAQAEVELSTKSSDGSTFYEMKVLTSTDRRAYLEFVAPKEERGRKMLARENQYWSTFPDSKRVVAISKKEMIGNSAFAMADIFEINAEKDYDAEIVGEEKQEGKSLLKLNLTAKHAGAPYQKIEYWVEPAGYFPVMAKMYTKSGKHLKSMSVESRKSFGDKVRPETTKMVDEVQKGQTSWWKNKTLTSVDVPDDVFTKDYLRRRQ